MGMDIGGGLVAMFGMMQLVLGFGLGGLPLGVLPGPEDPMMARVAPESCLVYVSWAGVASPDASSDNRTEKFLAEPEVQKFFRGVGGAVQTNLRTMVTREDENLGPALDAAMQSVRQLLTQPSAVFLSSVEQKDAGPEIRGGLVIHCGDQTAAIQAALEKQQPKILGPGAQQVMIAGQNWTKFSPGRTAPTLYWGFREKYFILAVGEGELPAIIGRMAGQPPAWLSAVREELPIERRSSVLYVNVRSILSLVSKEADEDGQKAMQALALDKIEYVATVAGLDKSGFVSRMRVKTEAKPGGVFNFISNKPLDVKDLAAIPHDAVFAVAVRLDPADVWKAIGTMTRTIDAQKWEETAEGLAEFEQEYGIRLQDDVLGPLGDVACVYVEPLNLQKPMLGITLVVRVDDAARLAKAHDKFLATWKKRRAGNEGSPEVKQTKIGERQVFFVEVGSDFMPITPTWCLTENALIFSYTTDSVKRYLSRGADFQSLASVPEVARLFEATRRPAVVTFQNTPQLVETYYPVAPTLLSGLQQQLQQMGLNTGLPSLPSQQTILKHLGPSVAAIYPGETGFEFVNRQTLPGTPGLQGSAIASSLMVPLMLNGVQLKPSQTRSMNNLKQIGMALNQYCFAYNRFPPPYTVDKSGKPLLSWRVHILRYLDIADLYEEFHLDEPWDSEHNKKLIDRMPSVYRAPGSRAEKGKTNYCTIRGKRTVLPGKEAIGIQHITDGTSNTLMTVEVSDDKAVIWTKPDDFEPDPKDPIKGLVGLRSGGFLGGFADGSVRLFRKSIDPKTLELLFDRADGKRVNREDF